MLDRPEFDRWLGAADDAFDAARVQTKAGIHHWACFLAEQCAQLAVKGLLQGLGAGGGWGHDLVELGERMSEVVDEPLPERVAEALQRLSRHYIPPRYPDAHPSGTPGKHYSAHDAGVAMADTESVLRSVRETWVRAAGEL